MNTFVKILKDWYDLLIYFGIFFVIVGALGLQGRNRSIEELSLPTSPTIILVSNYDASCSIGGQKSQFWHNASSNFELHKRFDIGDPARRAAYEATSATGTSIYFGKWEKIVKDGVLQLPITTSPRSCKLLEEIDFFTVQTYSNLEATCEFFNLDIVFPATCKIQITSVSDCLSEPNDFWGCNQTSSEERQEKRTNDEALWLAYQALHSSKN